MSLFTKIIFISILNIYLTKRVKNRKKERKMSKQMQKIVLFIEPNDDGFYTPEKIGHLFMNRFSVDEDASCEILNVLELGKASTRLSRPKDPEYANFENERKEKGMGLVSMACILETIK